MLNDRFPGEFIRALQSVPSANGTVVAAIGMAGGMVVVAPWDAALQSSGNCPGPVGIVVQSGTACLVQVSGAVGRSVSGLPALGGYATVSATATLVHVVSPSATDRVFGTVDSSGVLTINIFPAVSSPSGWRVSDNWTGMVSRWKLQGDRLDSGVNGYDCSSMYGGTLPAFAWNADGSAFGSLEVHDTASAILRNGVSCPNLLILGDLTVGATAMCDWMVGNQYQCIAAYHGPSAGNSPWMIGVRVDTTYWKSSLYCSWQYNNRIGQDVTFRGAVGAGEGPSVAVSTRGGGYFRAVFRRTMTAPAACKVDLWVNGVLRGTVANLVPPDDTAAGDDRRCSIGKRSGVSDPWDGNIADVQVANRALTDAEIVADWKAVHG